MFHNDTERTLAMGLYTTCFSAGTMLGPIIGGFLLSHFHWGSIFLMPVPLILLLLFTAPFFLPEFKDQQSGKLDYLSAILLIAATLPVIFGIKQMAQNGLNLLPLAGIAAGCGIAIWFVRRQKLLSHPLIDLDLFRKSGFNAALAALFIGLFSWSGMFLFVGQYLQAVAGLSSFSAGLWMLPGALGSILLCMLAPVIVGRYSRGKVITTGLIVLAIGIGMLGFLNVNALPLLVVSIFLMSGGCGLTVTLGIDMVVAAAPPNKAGAAAGISETSTAFGGALGVALLGSTWTAFYRSNMSKTASGTEAARNTIGGAVSEAGKLHNLTLLNDAKEAFVHSLNITAVICAIIVIATAAVVAAKFKNTAGVVQP
jgi:DHA2 family multidrug resistance protein-like MFS transporter